MYKPSPRFPQINDNRRWLLIKILTKYIMTPKFVAKIDFTLQTGTNRTKMIVLCPPPLVTTKYGINPPRFEYFTHKSEGEIRVYGNIY